MYQEPQLNIKRVQKLKQTKYTRETIKLSLRTYASTKPPIERARKKILTSTLRYRAQPR